MNLSQMLMEWAEENELHEPGDGPCYCDICQKFVPAAIELEQRLHNIRELLPNNPDDALDDRIRHIEKHGDPDGLTPDDVCGIMEKMYIEQWGAIFTVVNPLNNANGADGQRPQLAQNQFLLDI